MSFHQEIFRSHNEFTVVRPIKLSTTENLEMGDQIDKSLFRLFHLKSLYNRRKIGVKDAPWTISMLENPEKSNFKPELSIIMSHSKRVEPVIKEKKVTAKVKKEKTVYPTEVSKPWEI